MRIVPLYAALLALLFVVLSVRTLRLRRQLQIAVGDGGQPQMLRAMRVHANFAEYTPLALLLLYMAEGLGQVPLLIHLLGLTLLLGRAAHAWGVSRSREDFRFRVFGMAATFSCLVGSSLLIAWLSLARQTA